MNGAEPRKLNCWESLGCGRGPGSLDPCVVATDSAGNGVNGGTNGGRSCWAVVGTVSGGEELAPCAQGTSCLTCDFFRLVKSEEGPSFQFLKLAKGVSDLQELQETIGRVESLMAIHERMRTDFDLRTTIREITEEARKLTGAQRSLVLLVRGKPPALHGEFVLKGELKRVKIDFHESSAVGYAAVHNHMVNLKNIYGALHSSIGPVFNRAFDKQCDCRTHSFLAAPICDAQERVIGVITAANARKGFFSSDDEWFVEKYATEVALAVEKQKFIQQSVSAVRLSAIGETVAGLSHCIKNIAQALRAGSHIIKRAIRSNSVQDISAAWGILDRHIERLADLSIDVLAYDPVVRERSKGGALNEVVRHVVELFEEEARARAVQLTLDVGDNVDPAKFDPMGIYRCVVNLIINAFDACPLSDGMVAVATRRTGEKEVMISVADNGRGMDEETKAAIFEFFRTSQPRRGTGLGLATVADIVDRHNGRIEVDSEVGGGAIFKVFVSEDIVVV